MKKLTKALVILGLFVYCFLNFNVLDARAAGNWNAPVWKDYKTATVEWICPDDISEYDVVYIRLYKGDQSVCNYYYDMSLSYYRGLDAFTLNFNNHITGDGQYTVKADGYKERRIRNIGFDQRIRR